MTSDKSGGPQGILLIDKAMGWTSHDVVAKARRITRQRRIGHTGTLDPMATGLLVLCLGSATRVVEYMTRHDKRYVGEVALGATTDTDDAEGTILKERAVPTLGEERLRHLEAHFSGAIEQVPPAYSAIKVAGERAYAVARKGGHLELAPRPVQVHSITLRPLIAGLQPALAVEVHCGPGTYIRSLARDIGREVGCGAHLRSLRRVSVAAFDVQQAWTLDQLEALTNAGLLEEILLSPDEGIATWECAIVGEETATRFGHGLATTIEAALPHSESPIRVYSGEGGFLGVAVITSVEQLKPLKVLAAV